MQVGDVTDDRNDLVLGGRCDSNLEIALLPQVCAEAVLNGREPAGLERRTDARHQLLGDVGWKQIADPRPDNDIRRIREA